LSSYLTHHRRQPFVPLFHLVSPPDGPLHHLLHPSQPPTPSLFEAHHMLRAVVCFPTFMRSCLL
jgi:hypothetical protein